VAVGANSISLNRGFEPAPSDEWPNPQPNPQLVGNPKVIRRGPRHKPPECHTAQHTDAPCAWSNRRTVEDPWPANP